MLLIVDRTAVQTLESAHAQAAWAYDEKATYRRKMSRNLTKIGAYKRRAALVMALVLACHLLGGTGLFCANQFPHASRSSGNNRTAPVVAANDQGGVSPTVWSNADSQGRTSPCSCKKHKCPTIPRTTLASNPTHRFNEVQRQVRSACADSLAADVTNHRFASGSASPFMRFVWGTAFSRSTLLVSTCVLLI